MHLVRNTKRLRVSNALRGDFVIDARGGQPECGLRGRMWLRFTASAARMPTSEWEGRKTHRRKLTKKINLAISELQWQLPRGPRTCSQGQQTLGGVDQQVVQAPGRGNTRDLYTQAPVEEREKERQLLESSRTEGLCKCVSKV